MLVMNVRDYLDNICDDLLANSSTPRLDAELLVCFALNKQRTWLRAHDDYELNIKETNTLNKLVNRRIRREPIAYITGTKEFYGRSFCVNKHVLVPRPESESFIEIIKQLLHEHDSDIKQREISITKGLGNSAYNRSTGFIHSVLDVGTGSGCLAITIKKEFPELFVTATDVSTHALKVAIANAKSQGTDIVFKKQSLLTNDKQGYDIVVANLPYVPDGQTHHSIAHEPEIALFSGRDGLNHYQELFIQLKPKHIRYVLTESLQDQHMRVRKLASDAGYELVGTNGLVQLFNKQ